MLPLVQFPFLSFISSLLPSCLPIPRFYASDAFDSRARPSAYSLFKFQLPTVVMRHYPLEPDVLRLILLVVFTVRTLGFAPRDHRKTRPFMALDDSGSRGTPCRTVSSFVDSILVFCTYPLESYKFAPFCTFQVSHPSKCTPSLRPHPSPPGLALQTHALQPRLPSQRNAISLRITFTFPVLLFLSPHSPPFSTGMPRPTEWVSSSTTTAILPFPLRATG